MDRPARVQVNRSDLDELSKERHIERQHELGAAAVYNVWHRKWAGADKMATQFRSSFRCDPAKDSGETRSLGPYFCLWFARGCCYKGQECTFLHRVPGDDDILKLYAVNTTDCFGRAKFSAFRDDMNGVGSFLRPCRTLFVGYFKHQEKSRSKLVSQVREQFSAWGPVRSVRVDKTSSFAFVTFVHQSSAEFAKEAMSNQTITGKETLVVRWAQSSNEPENDEAIHENKIRTIVRQVLARKGSHDEGNQDTGNQDAGGQDSNEPRPVSLIESEAHTVQLAEPEMLQPSGREPEVSMSESEGAHAKNQESGGHELTDRKSGGTNEADNSRMIPGAPFLANKENRGDELHGGQLSMEPSEPTPNPPRKKRRGLVNYG